MSYINSLSESLYLVGKIQSQQSQLSTLQNQISSGQKATDFSGYSASDGRLSIALRANLDRNNEYSYTIATLSTRTHLIENSLTGVHDALSSIKNTVTALGTATTQDNGQAIRIAATSALQQIISKLNVSVDGISLFSGRAVNASGSQYYPIAAPDTIAANVATAIAGGGGPYATPAAAQAAVDTAFGTAGAALTNWFLPGTSGNPAGAVQISDDRTVSASFSALPTAAGGTNNGIIDTLRAVAGLATLQPSDFASGLTGYQNYCASTIQTLLSADAEINTAVTANGAVRQALADQSTINSAQSTILETSVNTTENVDQAEAISRLNNLQTQLQASYQVTAQLKGLSLAAYL
jgi:flagellar hook-associated protein 3 FlgL